MRRKKKPHIASCDFLDMEARAALGIDVARAIDAATPIPYADTVHVYKFRDLLDALTLDQFELLRLSRFGKKTIKDLAHASGRESSAVAKDIEKLGALELITVILESKDGQQAQKLVMAVKRNLEVYI